MMLGISKIKLRLFHFGNGHFLIVGLLLAHLSLIFVQKEFSARLLSLSILMYFLTGCIGSSMVLHRYLSHRAWYCPRWLEVIGTFFITVGLIGSTITWVSIHRAHHMHTDTPKDPHSPHFKKWWKVHFFAMFYSPKIRLAKDLIGDPLHKFTHRYYWLINFLFAAVLLAFGLKYLLWLYLVPAVLLWHAGSGINSLGHLWGRQNVSKRDQSRNNFLLALLMWGEGWHNNHHRFPKRSTFRIRWYEFDISGVLIQVLQGRKKS